LTTFHDMMKYLTPVTVSISRKRSHIPDIKNRLMVQTLSHTRRLFITVAVNEKKKKKQKKKQSLPTCTENRSTKDHTMICRDSCLTTEGNTLTYPHFCRRLSHV